MLWLLVALQCCLAPAQVRLVDPISAEASELASSQVRLSEATLKRSRERDLRISKAGQLIAKIKLAADELLQAEESADGDHSPNSATQRLRSLKREEARSREELQHLKAKLYRASNALEKVKAATAEVKTMTSKLNGNERSSKMRLRDMVLKLQMDKAVEEKSSKAVETARALEIKAHNAVLRDLEDMEDLERILAQAPHA